MFCDTQHICHDRYVQLVLFITCLYTEPARARLRLYTKAHALITTSVRICRLQLAHTHDRLRRGRNSRVEEIVSEVLAIVLVTTVLHRLSVLNAQSAPPGKRSTYSGETHTLNPKFKHNATMRPTHVTIGPVNASKSLPLRRWMRLLLQT